MSLQHFQLSYQICKFLNAVLNIILKNYYFEMYRQVNTLLLIIFVVFWSICYKCIECTYTTANLAASEADIIGAKIPHNQPLEES